MGAFAMANLCQGAENQDTLKEEEDGNGLDLLQLTAACGEDGNKEAVPAVDTSELSVEALSYVSSLPTSYGWCMRLRLINS